MESFYIDIMSIQPSQLYLSQSKLDQIKVWFDKDDLSSFEPIPIKKLNNRIIFVDGHTRAYTALVAGMKDILVCWEPDEWDWEAYQICVDHCTKDGITNISDLKKRIVDEEEYKILWHKWCDELHTNLEVERASKKE